jgi:hypothetical protein
VRGKIGREAVVGVSVLSMPTVSKYEKERMGSQSGAVSVGGWKKLVRRFISPA